MYVGEGETLGLPSRLGPVDGSEDGLLPDATGACDTGGSENVDGCEDGRYPSSVTGALVFSGGLSDGVLDGLSVPGALFGFLVTTAIDGRCVFI